MLNGVSQWPPMKLKSTLSFCVLRTVDCKPGKGREEPPPPPPPLPLPTTTTPKRIMPQCANHCSIPGPEMAQVGGEGKATCHQPQRQGRGDYKDLFTTTTNNTPPPPKGNAPLQHTLDPDRAQVRWVERGGPLVAFPRNKTVGTTKM